jgi:glycogen debranching enzyme
MFEAGFRFSDARLPELFCGFSRDRRFNSSPAAYVVSCSPQAWAAGSLFMFLQSILDLRPDVQGNRVRLEPVLPDMFRRITLTNIRLGRTRVDVTVEGAGANVEVHAAERAPLAGATTA